MNWCRSRRCGILRFTLLLFSILLLPFVVGTKSDERANVGSKWRVFGPLPLPGVGADPLSSLGGSSLFQMLKNLNRFPSETALGGYATWNSTITNETTDVTTIAFNGSTPPLSAWATSSLFVSRTTLNENNFTFILMQCTHRTYLLPKTTSVDESNRVLHCLGGLVPCPLSLSAREYSIYMSLSSRSDKIPFGCIIDSSITSPALLPSDRTVKPSIIRHRSQLKLAGSHASVTVTNADDNSWAVAGTVSVTSSPMGLELTPSSPHPPRLAPGQTRAVRMDLDLSKVSILDLNAVDSLNVSVALSYTVGDQTRTVKYELQVDVLTWPPSSYAATYVDEDNSVQAVALKPPKGPCTDKCSVLFALHGAGVDALKRAWTESIKTQQNAWVVLPTGRRKFGENWEGAQMESALKSLEEVREQLPGVPDEYRDGSYSIRQDFVLSISHSMGAHGGIILSTHYPDLLVASLPIAGWLRYDTYGHTGPAFHPQLSFADAGLRGLFALSTEEYAGDLYSENIVGIPLTARVGSADMNVPRTLSSFLYALLRLLADWLARLTRTLASDTPKRSAKFAKVLSTCQGFMESEYELFYNINETRVTLNEVPGKGHWFGGVMDDNQLQPFIGTALLARAKPELPLKFSVMTQNPATTGSRGGLRIIVLRVPFQTARLSVRIEGNTWYVKTRNVIRIRYKAVNGLYPRPKRLVIDDGTPGLQIPRSIRNYNGSSTTYVDFCGVEKDDSDRLKWRHCADPIFPSSKTQFLRGPDNSGPLTAVLGARRVAIIYPTESKGLLRLATRYANALFEAGISVSVTSDTSAVSIIGEGTYNVIVLGGVGTNKAASVLQKISRGRTARTKKGKICIGSRCTKRPGTGVVFLTPGKLRTLGVVVAGTDNEGLSAALNFLPSSPDQQVPEWVLMNSEDGFGWRGYGGVEAAGYWDRNWRVEPALTYPATWAIGATQEVVINEGKLTRRVIAALVLICVVIVIAFGFVSRKRARRKDSNEERVAFISDES